jgi:hypothetical protein
LILELDWFLDKTKLEYTTVVPFEEIPEVK